MTYLLLSILSIIVLFVIVDYLLARRLHIDMQSRERMEQLRQNYSGQMGFKEILFRRRR